MFIKPDILEYSSWVIKTTGCGKLKKKKPDDRNDHPVLMYFY